MGIAADWKLFKMQEYLWVFLVAAKNSAANKETPGIRVSLLGFPKTANLQIARVFVSPSSSTSNTE